MSDVYVSGFRTQTTGEQTVASFLWDTGSLSWVPMTASTGTGGAVNVTNTFIPVQQYGTWSIGSTNTAANNPIAVRLTDGTSFYTATGGGSGGGNAAASATGSAIPTSADYAGWNSGGNLTGVSLTSAMPVQPGTGSTFPVSGTFWQATQPVSIASSVAVTGSFWQTTQPVSIASLPALSAGTALIGSIKITDGTNTLTLDQNNNDTSVPGEWTLPTENYNMVFNGTNWDRQRGTIAGGTLVQVSNASIPVTGTFWQATQPVSGTFYQATQPVSIATAPVLVAGSAVIGKVGIDQTTAGTTNGVVVNDQRSTSLWVTATAATGVAATASLPAPGVGLFHYITSIDIQLYATAARTGSATPVIVTSTNLPGTPAWNFPTAQAIGAIDRYDIPMTTPLRSSVANTITTIAAPIATTGLWRINVGYFTGA